MASRSAVHCHYVIRPAAAVRAHIARVLLPPPNEHSPLLGQLTLQPHQLLGVHRLLDVIKRHGGALLADEVGLGKTYTALAVARHFNRVDIAAPATLRAMWHEAASRADIPMEFVSCESLSRSASDESEADLVIVDEAHWFRNRGTNRYRRLAQRYRKAAFLLLSATPLHNRPADLTALFALFLGRRADRLTPHDVASMTVRRGRSDVPAEALPPRVMPTEWRRIRSCARLVDALRAVEPPIPVREGAVAMALLRLTWLHRLSSSHAALRATLKRLLSRALALLDAVNAGRYPTAGELRAWLVADDTIQLAFPELVVHASNPDHAISRVSIEAHIASVRAAITVLDSVPNQDDKRATFLVRLMRRFAEARIVAFSQYDATVTALSRRLRRFAGVAVLSAKGGRIASGRISRREVLQQFDAATAGRSVSEATRIRILLTTDLLSEGVNLHNAQVVVHLDIPWTVARLEQRVGRLSRIGSPHESVHVFGFAPPRALELAQRTLTRLRLKWRASRRRFGESALLLDEAIVKSRGAKGNRSHAEAAEELRRLLVDWLGSARSDSPGPHAAAIVAYVKCVDLSHPIALALLRTPSGPALLALDGAHEMTTHPHVVLRVAQHLSRGKDATSEHGTVAVAVQRVRRYLARRRGEEAAGADVAGAANGALLARIAQSITRLPRSRRPDAVRQAASLRALIGNARSAGDHALLAEKAGRLLEIEASDPMRWLDIARSEMASFDYQSLMLDRGAQSWGLDAILIGI
ncbi:MAG TPA: helicase-related protein [Gemmatimonadaceae bacterium]|nr:helicase-related protein [Gemmatimonadaceae bacterium]